MISKNRPLWLGAAPLVLASKSASRRAVLSAAGLHAEVVSAEVDERAFESRFFDRGGLAEDLAPALAKAKALAVSALRPDAYCLGADQTLTLENRLVHKARTMTEAAQSLGALAGRAHRLTSAFCIARHGKALVVDSDRADLQMRLLDETTITKYLDLTGPTALSGVGVYQLEGVGVHLFDRIDGDYFTILGIPLLKLLSWLRGEGLIAL